MKWNTLIASLMVSLGMCTSGFGFGFLDQMLGIAGGGPDPCCATPPACGCDAAPACGCAPSCAPTCDCCGGHGPCILDHILGGLHHGAGCCQPACGCHAAPACGCQVHCCKPKCCKPKCCKPKCCKPKCCKPKCCKPKCCHPCGGHGRCILDHILGGLHHGVGCCQPACGCDAVPAGSWEGTEAPAETVPVPAAPSESAPAAGASAPLPPAPVVDPSAFAPTHRSFIRASAISAP